jgi:tungstate transport system substrate-binding protein
MLVLVAGCTRPSGSASVAPQGDSGAVPIVSGIPTAQPGQSQLVLATTTSTQDSGLLDVLIPMFERATRYEVKTVSVGTGQALALGARGEADVVLVHAPEAERQWMAEGNGIERRLVMHNDFVIVGPPSDPAAIRFTTSAGAALQAIVEKQAFWVSRDDNSGTDQLEKQLWNDMSLSPAGQPWYLASGQGMGATLTLADHKDAYTLTDRATYLARQGTVQAVILVEGDPRLLNIYHVMPVNPAKFPGSRINSQGAEAFADFLVSPAVQQMIGEFGKDKYGQPLFFPDAGGTEESQG